VEIGAMSKRNAGADAAAKSQRDEVAESLRARGPMGLEALTTYKWIAWGDDTLRP